MSSIISSRASFLTSPSSSTNSHHRESTVSSSSSHPPSSTNSLYIIYRNYKYYGVVQRAFHYSLILIRYYIHEPYARKLKQLQNGLIELLGFLCVLLLLPVLCCSSLLLYLSRVIRIRLIRRFYPESEICEDFSLRSVFKNDSSQMLTLIIWINGKLTADQLRKKYFKNKSPALEKCISTKFGVHTFEKQKKNFNITNHIVERTSSSASHGIIKESVEHSLHGQKSKLQKLICQLVSKVHDARLPQWEITLIPIIVQQTQSANSIGVKTKEKTCAVLRFHYILLKEPSVAKFLDNIFSELSSKSVPIGANPEDPLKTIADYRHQFVQSTKSCLKRNLTFTYADVKSWWTLQIRKCQFYDGKSWKFLKILVYYHLWFNLRNFCTFPIVLYRNGFWHYCWSAVKSFMSTFVLLFRSLSYIPIQLIDCFIIRKLAYSTIKANTNTKYYGFSSFDDGVKEMCWSSLINRQLIESIKEKTASSTENVILSAISMGLNQYYTDMNLPNPSKLNVSVPICSPDTNLICSNEFYGIKINTANSSRRSYYYSYSSSWNERNVIEESNLENIPPRKLFGSSYLLTYISFCIPRYFAKSVLRRLYHKYPINLTFSNIHNNRSEEEEEDYSQLGSIPSLSFYGYPVDECTYWIAPQNDYCISIQLVNHHEAMRLVVLSPMKTLATSLTKHLDVHLNRLAEIVGVEKSRIPYSKKSTPNSTPSSSPNNNSNNKFGK